MISPIGRGNIRLLVKTFCEPRPHASETVFSERRRFFGNSTKTVALLTRIKANDERIGRINSRSLPTGAARLLSAELVARDLQGLQDGLHIVPSIKGDLRLPRFAYDVRKPYVWPIADFVQR